MLNRRGFLGVLAVGACARAGVARAAESDGVVARGECFLAGLIDPELDLLPEYPGAKTYWLYHDNYLAAKVLRRSQAAIADRTEAAIRGFGVASSGKIEIVTGEAKEPLPFRHHRLIEVARRGEKVIKTEIVTEEELQGWESYADLLFLAAIALAKSDRGAADAALGKGLSLWDGKGFRDRATEVSGLYATYKLALAMLAGRAVKREIAQAAAIRKRLLAMQAEDGGWVTDYDADLKAVGLRNVETTSLAILGLDESRSSKHGSG